jgi:hypothetical protein
MVKTLSFVEQISPKNKSDDIFGYYDEVQEPGKIVLKFYIFRVPPKQIPTVKGKNLSLVKQISPWHKAVGTFGNNFGIQEHNKRNQNLEIWHTKGKSHTKVETWVLLLNKFEAFLLLSMCGKFPRALLSHQIFTYRHRRIWDEENHKIKNIFGACIDFFFLIRFHAIFGRFSQTLNVYKKSDALVGRV